MKQTEQEDLAELLGSLCIKLGNVEIKHSQLEIKYNRLQRDFEEAQRQLLARVPQEKEGE